MGIHSASPMPTQSPDANQPNRTPAPFLSIAGALTQCFVDWPWAVILALVGGGLALHHWRRSRSRYGAVLMGVAAATATGAIFITAQIVAAVDGAGADLRVLGSLNPIPLRPETSPEDVTY